MWWGPQLGEADYDARLAAYARLQPPKWAALPAWHSAPLVHAALADLRMADDIALRHAAAQARLPCTSSSEPTSRARA